MKNNWKIGALSTVKKLLWIGIPLLAPIILNLMGSWKDVTLGMLLAFVVKFAENQFKHF